MSQPSVSVVISAYNASSTIEKCMESILNQDYHNMEVVVVDDGSIDDTLKKVSKYKANIIAKPSRCGVAHSRNLGAKNSNSEVLIFVDSDIVITPGAISRIIKTFNEKPDILAIGARYSENTKDFNFASDFKNMDLSYRCHLCADYVKYLGSFFMAIKKETFLKAKGFAEDFSKSPTAEDIEFGYRVTKGKKAMFIDKAILVDHLKKYTLLSMLKTDFVRIVNMMKIIKLSKGKFKAGEHAPMPYMINLFLPVLIVLSVLGAVIFQLWWPSLLLATAFVINNFGFVHFLLVKRGVIFAVKSLLVLFIEYIIASFSVIISIFIPVLKVSR